MAPKRKTADDVSEMEVNKTAAETSGETADVAATAKKPGRKKSVPETAAAPEMAAEPVKVEEKKAQSRKTAAKKASVKRNLYVQFADRELRLSESDLAKEAQRIYEELGSREGEIGEMDLYVKPEEGVAYFAVNGQGSDEYKIVL